jgi:hypothetical protein
MWVSASIDTTRSEFTQSLSWIWDAKTGAVLARLKGHQGSVNAVAVTKDGTRVFTGSSDTTARIWDGNTGAELVRFKHQASINAVVITANGARIVTGSDDRTVRVWNAETGTPLAQIDGHQGHVNAVALSADEARIISGGDDNTARIWEFFPSGQALVDQAKAVVPRCLTPAQRQQFNLSSTVPIWCGKMEKWPYDEVSWLIEGRRLLGEGHDEEAAVLFTEALGRDPAVCRRIDEAWAQAYLDRGRRLVRESKDDEANVLFTEALKLDKAVSKSIDDAWANAYLDRGRRLLGEGRYDEANALFSEVLKRDPSASKRIDEARAKGSGATSESSCNTAVLRKIFDPAREEQPPCFPGPDSEPTGGLSQCKTVCVTLPPKTRYNGFQASMSGPNGWWGLAQKEPDKKFDGQNQNVCMPFLQWSHDLDRTARFCVEFAR